MNLIFVSSPFSDNPERRIEMARGAVTELSSRDPDSIYFSPLLYFPQYLEDSDPVQREKAFEYIFEMIDRSDGIVFVSDVLGWLSPGMNREHDYALDTNDSRYEVEFTTFAVLGVY